MFISSVLGALTCHAFTEFLEDVTGIDNDLFEPVARRNHYLYVATEPEAWTTIPALSTFSLNLPQFFLDEYFPDGGAGGWEAAVLEAIHTSQFLQDCVASSNTIGRLMHDGLQDSQGIVAVPETVFADPVIVHPIMI